MKKVSTASLICAIVLIIGAIVLNVIGFSYINGVRYVGHMGYGFMRMSYYTDSSMTATCLAMIIVGGFLFIGGVLLLMLAAATRCRDHKCCRHKAEQEAAPVAEPCSCSLPENTEEQNQ